jgi:hypothetical protein
MLVTLKKIDTWLHRHLPLLLILCFLIVLRLPNLCEPYWYGDEGIYLALGNAMRHGERLYLEIIDHKTPLIYYLAMVPSQLHFRILLMVWMLVTTVAFYYLAKALLKRPVATWISTFLFMLFTTLPWLEGNIPNGELFVMGFVLVGGWIFSRTQVWQNLFHATDSATPRSHRLDAKLLAASGVMFNLGILTKVPSLFDTLAFFGVSWLALTRDSLQVFKHPKHFFKLLSRLVVANIWLVAGLLLPIIISIVYFISRGSGQAYLDYGLLYNFRYAGSWGLPFSHPLLLFLFSLPGKAMVMAALILMITALAKVLRPQFQFVAMWSILAFFASLLSNRPYPHYFLQAIPPLALLIGVLLDNWGTKARSARFWLERGTELVITILIGTLLASVLLLLEFGLYPTASYYQRWFDNLTGRITREQYQHSFNYLMEDNYLATKLIKESPDPYLFIWGTNPMLYAQTGKVPTGRFTVSFHIKDFQAFDETVASVIAKRPDYIVVMKDETHELPELTRFLRENYMPNSNFKHFTLWKEL